jgi:hypothetical protein
MQEFIRKILLKFNVFSSRAKASAEIKELINKLKLIKTQFDLRRIGNRKGDGGYLLPDDFEGINYCFSPGVSDEFSFDGEILSMGIECFLADFYVEESPIKDSNVKFLKKFVSSFDDHKHININRWISENINKDDGDGIMQMDIEGQEYEVINAFDTKNLNKFRILVIEFHDLHYLFDRFAFDIISNTFSKLLDNYRVVHIHPNNSGTVLSIGGIEIPNVMEFTFLRKDRVKTESKEVKFPHELDFNNVDGPDVALPRCWYT